MSRLSRFRDVNFLLGTSINFYISEWSFIVLEKQQWKARTSALPLCRPGFLKRHSRRTPSSRVPPVHLRVHLGGASNLWLHLPEWVRAAHPPGWARPRVPPSSLSGLTHLSVIKNYRQVPGSSLEEGADCPHPRPVRETGGRGSTRTSGPPPAGCRSCITRCVPRARQKQGLLHDRRHSLSACSARLPRSPPTLATWLLQRTQLPVSCHCSCPTVAPTAPLP